MHLHIKSLKSLFYMHLHIDTALHYGYDKSVSFKNYLSAQKTVSASIYERHHDTTPITDKIINYLIGIINSNGLILPKVSRALGSYKYFGSGHA